jgi:hypothetical protein
MSKLKLLPAIILLFSVTVLKAQIFSADLIPDSLKINAHYVIRDYNQELELFSQNTGVEKVKRVLTILDKEGEKMASLIIPYDKNSSVTIKQITLYNGNGEKIKNVKQTEITDSPAYSTSELFSDSRIKYYKPLSPVYPYTVEYNFEVDMKNIISLGCWHPFDSYNVSTQHSRLMFSYPSGIKINRKEINIHSDLSERRTDNIIDTWEVYNLKALEHEPFDIILSERIPSVYLMPSLLIYDKYVGTADSWSGYGKWVYSLYRGRDILSDAEKTKVESLIKDVPDTLDRIRSLYKYMQENTRFVAIILGLGGYQPFDAQSVFATGYGDCKALTNYMYSLLKSVGVKSYPAIVSSGRYKKPIFTDFPNFQQFDHVILCIPYSRDTIWLECTDQKIPFGFLGDFTDDRDVLLITENGGIFAHTRKYDASDNIRSCKAEFIIDSTGTASCDIKTFYMGLQYDNISDLLYMNYDEQKKWLYSYSGLPSLLIKDFSVTDLRGAIPAAIITESEVSKSYCSFSGSYMLLSLNVLNTQKSIQKMLKTRHSDILINRSSIDYDTMIYKIPKNYSVESFPAPTLINSKFGSYSGSVALTDKGIIYIRKFTLLEGRYNPQFYKELYDFIMAVSKADNAKLILTKKS